MESAPICPRRYSQRCVRVRDFSVSPMVLFRAIYCNCSPGRQRTSCTNRSTWAGVIPVASAKYLPRQKKPGARCLRRPEINPVFRYFLLGERTWRIGVRIGTGKIGLVELSFRGLASEPERKVGAGFARGIDRRSSSLCPGGRHRGLSRGAQSRPRRQRRSGDVYSRIRSHSLGSGTVVIP